MKQPLTSRSPRRRGGLSVPASAPPGPSEPPALGVSNAAAALAREAAPPPPAAERQQVPSGSPAAANGFRARAKRFGQRFSAPLWALGGAALAVVTVTSMQPQPIVVTQDDIERAVRHTLEQEPLPSQAAKAYQEILPSVVRVLGLMNETDAGEEVDAEQRAMERSLGTGVVIQEDGTILTNLHVVWGAKRIRVRFFDGQESEAVMVGAQPENDLAVLKASTLPDDLEPAVMTSTADLSPGDHVLAVGYPFGIGPSASYGVVSGLRREFRSPEGERMLSNLIQFDAAANPGNSGGPLVTMDGHLVGIVTAILNPSDQRTFIGIGFAVPIENAAQAAGMPPF
jgi:S1-C subfamily serine protease